MWKTITTLIFAASMAGCATMDLFRPTTPTCDATQPKVMPGKTLINGEPFIIWTLPDHTRQELYVNQLERCAGVWKPKPKDLPADNPDVSPTGPELLVRAG